MRLARQPDLMFPALTRRQGDIVRYCDDYLLDNGHSPAYREIGAAVGLKSPSSVRYQLDVLRGKGYLSRDAGCPRTAVARVPGTPPPRRRDAIEDQGLTRVPLIGRIAAGLGVTAIQLEGELVPLPKMFTGNGSHVMLQVVGDSMVDAAIADGDWVVVRRDCDVTDGDIVAALLDSSTSTEGESTVKEFKRIDGHVWLLPHNPVYQPIAGDNARILGKVVSVHRCL